MAMLWSMSQINHQNKKANNHGIKNKDINKTLQALL
jgi:hypothetical protein